MSVLLMCWVYSPHVTVGSSGTLYARYGSTSQLIRTTVTFGAEYGPTVTFGVRIGLRCCIGLRSSTFLSLIFGRCCNHGGVIFSCRWTFSVILYVFLSHFRHSSSRQLLETFGNLYELRQRFFELEHYIQSPRFLLFDDDSISGTILPYFVNN